MATKPELSRTPEGIVPSLLQHFNSMDVDVMCGFYEPDAILVSASGEPQRGISAIRAELLKYYAVQLPMVIVARHVFVADTMPRWSSTGTSFAARVPGNTRGDPVRAALAARPNRRRPARSCDQA